MKILLTIFLFITTLFSAEKVVWDNDIKLDDRRAEQIYKAYIDRTQSDDVKNWIKYEIQTEKELITKVTSNSILDGEVSAYFVSKIVSLDEIKRRLEKENFKVVSTMNIDTNTKSVIFTSKQMIEMSNLPGRGFASYGTVTIYKNKGVSLITNPVYFGKAYLQQYAKMSILSEMQNRLIVVFNVYKYSPQRYPLDDLSSYRYKSRYPEYKNLTLLIKSSTSKLLSNFRKNTRESDRSIIKLSDDRYLLLYNFSTELNYTLKRIGSVYALLMPIPIMIDRGKAYTMNPKYYIPVHIPKIDIDELKQIASIPKQIKFKAKSLFY